MARQMKDSGVEWIGEIPADWEVIPHKYIMHKEKEICDKYNNEDIISLTMNGVIVRDLVNPIGKMPATFDGYQKVYAGNLLMCLFDIDVTPRCIGYIRNNGLTSPAYSQFVVDNCNHAQYYNYLLRMIDDGKYFLHLSKNLRSSLTEENFGIIKTVKPPIKDQKRIADFLDEKIGEIDTVIAKTKETIEDYKKYKQAIINEIIQNENDFKYKFRYLGELKNGLNYHSVAEKESVKFLGVGNFKDFMILNKRESFSDLSIDTELPDEYLLRNGDIIFVRSNGSKDLVGRSVMVDNIDFKLTYSGFCIRFRNEHTELVSNNYLLYFFRSESFKQLLYAGSDGMAINNLSQDILNSVKIPTPSIKSQDSIVKYLDEKCSEIDKLIAKKEELLVDLEDYKKSFIYEYVTGKKEVVQEKG